MNGAGKPSQLWTAASAQWKNQRSSRRSARSRSDGPKRSRSLVRRYGSCPSAGRRCRQRRDRPAAASSNRRLLRRGYDHLLIILRVPARRSVDPGRAGRAGSAVENRGPNDTTTRAGPRQMRPCKPAGGGPPAAARVRGVAGRTIRGRKRKRRTIPRDRPAPGCRLPGRPTSTPGTG